MFFFFFWLSSSSTPSFCLYHNLELFLRSLYCLLATVGSLSAMALSACSFPAYVNRAIISDLQKYSYVSSRFLSRKDLLPQSIHGHNIQVYLVFVLFDVYRIVPMLQN